MTRIRRLFEGRGVACLGIALFAACAIMVFFPALPKFVGLVSPDSMPFFQYANRTITFESLLGGGAFTPHSLYWLLFNPLYAHELTYIIDSFVLALAGVYYLAGRRVHPLAAWAGGLALGLGGYTFTLFCAGHRGYFHMFSCAVWAFGLLIRCFETRKLFYFAMLGLVLAWGVPYQADVLVLVVAVAAAYALWLTFQNRIEKSADSKKKAGLGRAGENVVAVWPRFAVSVLVLALAGFGGLRTAVTTQMTNRDAQIAGVSEQDFKPDNKPAKLSDAEKHNRWIFATNWSLPPEDMLEFIAPGVFGDESMQGSYPYWGRLGRPSDEVFQKGRMMPNYRGHTVYLGVVSVLFALFGVLAWFSSRKTKDVAPPQAGADYSDVPFWCGVWAVCLILAMGRYTPFYKLFFAIPYMDYIRAPVKFHHLVEVATAFLAGFGMDAFLRTERPALRRRLMWLAGALTGSLLVCALVMVVAKPQIVRHISELGLGQAAQTLGGYAVQNLMRSACLAALVAGLAYVACKGSGRALVRIGCVLLTVLAVEQAWVARRYVKVINVEPLYYENAVVRAIKKSANGQRVNVVNYVTPNVWGRDWFSSSLSMNGIYNAEPSADEMDKPYGRLFTGLQNDPVRLWKVLHAHYVIVPRKGIEAFVRAGVLRPVLDFELGASVVRQVPAGEKTLTLASIRSEVKAPRLDTDWQGAVPADKQADAVTKGELTVSDAPLAAGAKGAEAGDVRVLASRGLPGILATRIQVSTPVPGLLVFDERLAGKQEVLLDGKPAALYVADAIWPATLVPAGEHVVVLRNQRSPAVFLLSGLTTLAVLGWGLAFTLSKNRFSCAGAVA